MNTPVIYETSHTINFSELDPYNHLHTAVYCGYFIDHRMIGLREHAGWDIRSLAKLPFMTWVRRMEVDFIKPVTGDQKIIIQSFVHDFNGPDAYIECTMADVSGKILSRCLMVVACVDKDTRKSIDWPDDAKTLFFKQEGD